MISDEGGNTTRTGTQGIACRIGVKVVPNSSRDEIVGPLGDRLKIKVAAPPEGGRANRAVCRLMAAAAGVPERAVTVVAGQGRAEKTLRVEGRSAADLGARLGV